MTPQQIKDGAPDGATHYFVWWNGTHVFKLDCGVWYWLINNRWTDTDLLKIYWFFGGLLTN